MAYFSQILIARAASVMSTRRLYGGHTAQADDSLCRCLTGLPRRSHCRAVLVVGVEVEHHLLEVALVDPVAANRAEAVVLARRLQRDGLESRERRRLVPWH